MRVVFFGTPEFAVASLDAIVQSPHEVVAVVTVPDKPAGRGQKLLCSDVKQYAVDHGIEVLQPERLRNDDFLSRLRAFEADCFVVVAFRMLPEAVWGMPPRGTFNLHASLLPRYRGAAPINWAIINGESETGVTTFMLNHNIDEGNILLQESTSIAPDETVGTLYERLSTMGRGLVVRTLDGLQSGTLELRPQQGTPCAAPKIFKETTLIDFGHSAIEVERFVRGLSPYPAATMRMVNPKGEVVAFKVFSCKATDEPSMGEKTLQTDGKKVLKIAANDCFVSILELQMAGKKRNRIDDFLRGTDLIGWKLGC